MERAEAVVFRRGYVSNLGAVAAQLEPGGRTMASLDEAWVLSEARRLWGADLSRHLCGEFALVFLDREGGTASLHHDEFGLMPLFHSAGNGSLMVAFHLDELAAQSGTSDLDADYIREWLRFGEILSDLTPYRFIRRLAPGQSAIWDGRCLSLHDCWSPPALAEPAPGRSFADNAVELRSLIASAVAAALPSDGKVWAELSGGLDSSTIVAMALQGGAAGLEAVTYAYPRSPEADEGAWVEAFRHSLPLPLHVIDGDAFLPFTPHQGRQPSEPGSAVMNAARDGALLNLVTLNGVDIVLTGMGGDEILFGYPLLPLFIADALGEGRLSAAALGLRRWSGSIYPRRSSLFWIIQVARRLAGGHSDEPAPPWMNRRDARSAEFRTRAFDDRGVAGLPPSKASYMKGVLAGARVVSSALGSRRSATEFRSPFFHRRLVEFCRDLPWSHQAEGDIQRPLQRAAMTGILPEPIRRRKDKPNFDQAVFKGLASRLAQGHGDGGDGYLVAAGYIDGDSWRDALDKAQVGFAPKLKAFLSTLTLELWLRSRFGDSAGR